VVAVQQTYAMAESEIYTVFCLVAGEDVSFPVEIEKSKTVGQLKDAIKKKNPTTFDGIDAKSLTLYHVDLPDDDDLDQNVNKELERKPKPLRPSEEMADIFSEGLKKRMVHILVQPSRSGKSTYRLS